MSNYRKAEALFKKYKYSHFHMARENVSEYEEYLKFGISKEQENVWVKKHLIELEKQLFMTKNNSRIADLTEEIVNCARNLGEEDAFGKLHKYLMNHYGELDTNTLVRMASAILDLYNLLIYSNGKKLYMMNDVLELLKENNVITISKDYEIDGHLPDYLTYERVEKNLFNIINGYVNALK